MSKWACDAWVCGPGEAPAAGDQTGGRNGSEGGGAKSGQRGGG